MRFIQNGDALNLNNQMNIGVLPSQPSSASAQVVLQNNYGYYYGLQGENDGLLYNSSLPIIMPLKSDGSLYEIEALSRTPEQGIAVSTTTSTPKQENFFGDQTMLNSHYKYNAREAMPLSLDSSFRNPIYVNHVKENTNLQQNQQEIINQYYYSALRNQFLNGGESVAAFGDLQPLSLSMSPSSQSSCVTSSQQISPAVAIMSTKKRGPEMLDQNGKQIVQKKSSDTFGQRTSQYRGVTRHRWTGRYEAHLWDNSCKKEGQIRKGRQVYLGGYDLEEKAARAYDMAALKYWGPSTHINFPLENYQNEIEEMKNMSRQEYVAHLRRKSSGFSRGASMYRGVTRHHQHGRWQARIGRVAGNKDLYLGTFSTQEEAGEAYDIAAIKFRGISAVTNFDITRYDVERIMASSDLLTSDLAIKRKRENTYDDDDDIVMQQHKKRCKTQSSELLQDNTILFGVPSTAAPSTTIPPHLRPLLSSLPHMPLFAAWTDP